MVVGEAMAAGVPCVVTEVGDSKKLVGEADWVVPHGDPISLANALLRMVELSDLERWKLGSAGRERVKSFFSLELMCSRYSALYEGSQGELRSQN